MSIAKYLAKLAQSVDSQGQLSVSSIGGVVDTTPTITAIAYPGDDTATDPAGGQTITLTGTNFANGAKVIVGNTTAGVVTVVSSTQLTFIAPAVPAGSYILYVVNANGSTAIAAPGIQYSTVPIFTTAAGSLGAVYETTTVNTVTAATSDSTISYYLQSGTLPAGVTLNSSTGTITGTSPATAASTTYTFTIRATDDQLQDGTREFSLTINPDVINWVSPTNGTTLTNYQGISAVIPITTTTGSGSSVTYSASGLPTGLTLSAGNISGTPTTVGTSSSTITGTTVNTNRSSQITFTWTISVLGDTYWPQTTSLFNANSPSGTDIFIADSSLNNNQLTVFGDTRPSRQNPYQAGYYSNYFDGTGDYLLTASLPAVGTANFTVECWVYLADGTSASRTIFSHVNGLIPYITPTTINWGTGGTSDKFNVTVANMVGKWNHVAFVRSGTAAGQCAIYLNGVSVATGTDATNYTAGAAKIGIEYGSNVTPFLGHISNLRFVSGTAIYSSTFTPSTAPLTSVSGTILLTCQSNRLIDTSVNNFALTKFGDTAVSQFSPFAVPTNTYGSAYFDGTGDYLKTTSLSPAQFGTGDFTIEFWVYLPSIPIATALIDFRAANGATFGQIYVTTAGVLRLYLPTDVGTTNTIPLNAWAHLAITRASGTVQMFINGVSGYSGTQSGALNSAALSIGGAFDGTTPVTGYISDVRFVTGTALYTANFTPPTQPLTAVTNTSLLTLQTSQPTNNSQFVDNSLGANLVTRSGNVSQGSLNPYGSGHSIYANVGGSQGWLQPSGVYAKTGNTTSGVVDLTGAFTFEAWVYMTAAGRNVIFGETNGNAYSTAWGIGIFDTANAVSTGVNPGLVFLRSPISGYGGSFVYGSGLGFPTLNKWTHVAMCRDASNNWHFYMDGVKGTTANVNSLVNANVQMPANNGPTGTLSLNLSMFNWDGFISGGNSTSMSAGFNGYLNDVRLIEGTALYTGTSLTVPTAPLTPVPGTIVLLGQDSNYTNFANDKGITFTPTSVVGTNLRTDKFSKFNTTAGRKTPTSYSNYFDGTGDYLSTAVSTSTPGWNIMAPSGSGGGTVEAWIYRTNNTAGTGIPERIICGCLNLATAYTGWYLAVSSTGQLSIKGYTTGNTAASVNSGAGVVALNTWTHIAVSCNSGAVTFYINGVAYSGGSLPSTWLINNVATATMVGDAYPTWAAPFIGYISNLRMINNAAYYTAGALTVPSIPLTTTTNTTLLTCQDSTFKDNSVNAYALTPTGDVRPALTNPFGFTTTSNIPFSPSVNIGSAYFDGTGDWLTVPSTGSLDFNSDSWTIEGWVYPLGTTEMWVIAKRAGAAAYGPLGVAIRNQRLLLLGSSSGSGWTINSGVTDGTTPIAPGYWTHIAVVKNGTTVTGYVNGKVDQTWTGISNLVASTAPITVGCGDANGIYPYTGHISNLRVIKGQALYTQAFAPPTTPPVPNKNTVLQLDMDKAAIIDATAARTFETIGDAKLATESAYNGNYYSNYFDGTGDYLTPSSNNGFAFGTGDFTIEYWTYASAGTNNYMFQISDTVGGFKGSSVNTIAQNLYTNGTVYMMMNGATYGPSATGRLPYNTWTHFAIVRASGVSKVYINGVLETAFGTSGAITDTTNYTGTYCVIGGGYGTGFVWNGGISNFRIVKGTALYTANFTPSTTPLTAVTNTQLLTCQSNKFVDNSANNLTVTKAGDVAVRSFNPFKRNTNTSMYFDGTGDYLSTPVNPALLLPGDFTIELWAYPTVFNTNNMLMGSANGASSDYFNISSSKLEFLSNGNFQAVWTATFVTNTWYHIVMTRTGSAISAFVNGTQLTLASGSATSTAQVFNSGVGLQIGRYGYDTAPWYYTGYIDDLRITKGINRYPTNFTPPTYELPNK